MKPLWRAELTTLTGYTQEDLSACLVHLWTHYCEAFPQRDTPRASREEAAPIDSPAGVQDLDL